ncbi:MAG: TRAP transporter large permease subunit [Clostridiales bacterium]
MYIVIIPMVVMIGIVLIKKIPVIGGNIQVALISAGLLSLILGGIYNPINWLQAWISGVDRIAWVIFLSVFGSIYAETQTKMGALETVLGSLRARFGHSPRGLIVTVLIALGIAGSLLGDSIAAATVVGVLTVKSMADLGLSGELISGIIVIGASMGSIMPPISQAIFLSASLLNVNPDGLVQISYITVGLGIVFCCWFVATFYVKKDVRLPEELIPKETAGQILAQRWKTLIPLMVLSTLVILRSIPFPNGFRIDLIKMVLDMIHIGDKTFLSWIGGITILKGFSNIIVLAIIIAAIIAFIFYKEVRKDAGAVFIQGLKNVRTSASVQLCTGLMLGGFYAGGQIEAVKNFAMGLNATMLKWGGAGALTILGMLTGTQSTAQTTIFSFLGPTLVEMGINANQVGVFGSHVAAAGQGLPPADLLTFVVAGLIGGMLNRKVDPLKSMIYSSVFCLWLFIAGMIVLYI